MVVCNYANENQTNSNITSIEKELFTKEIKIGSNIWIDEFLSILPRVKIGYGSIISSTRVVSKVIHAFSITVGHQFE